MWVVMLWHENNMNGALLQIKMFNGNISFMKLAIWG